MRDRLLLEILAMMRDAVERDRAQLVIEPDHRSLHGDLVATKEVPAMKEPQLAVVRSDAQRLARVIRRRANAKSPRLRPRHRLGDLFRERLVDRLALANDEDPVIARGIDGAIELG